MGDSTPRGPPTFELHALVGSAVSTQGVGRGVPVRLQERAGLRENRGYSPCGHGIGLFSGANDASLVPV